MRNREIEKPYHGSDQVGKEDAGFVGVASNCFALRTWWDFYEKMGLWVECCKVAGGAQGKLVGAVG